MMYALGFKRAPIPIFLFLFFLPFILSFFYSTNTAHTGICSLCIFYNKNIHMHTIPIHPSIHPPSFAAHTHSLGLYSDHSKCTSRCSVLFRCCFCCCCCCCWLLDGSSLHTFSHIHFREMDTNLCCVYVKKNNKKTKNRSKKSTRKIK